MEDNDSTTSTKRGGKKTDWIWLMCHLVAHRQQFCLPQERSQSTSTPSKQSLHDHRIQLRHVNVHFLVSKRCFLKFTKCIVQHCLASARTMWCGYMYAFKFVSTKVQYRSRKCKMFYICLLSTKYMLACFFSGFVRSALETESFSGIILLDNMPFRLVYCFHGSRIGCHKSWHVFSKQVTWDKTCILQTRQRVNKRELILHTPKMFTSYVQNEFPFCIFCQRKSHSLACSPPCHIEPRKTTRHSSTLISRLTRFLHTLVPCLDVGMLQTWGYCNIHNVLCVSVVWTWHQFMHGFSHSPMAT